MSLMRDTDAAPAKKRPMRWDRCAAGVLFALLFWLSQGEAAADDWPRFRGPRSDGISLETGLLESWTQGGPAEIWRIPLGSGFSGAAVVGKHIYTLEARGDQEYVLCLDTASGLEIWRNTVDKVFREPSYGDGPRSMPTVEDGMLWALGGSGVLAAFRTADGELLWSVDLSERFGTEAALFGYANMPLVVGERVVVGIPGAGGPSIFGFDKRSGELSWRAAVGESSYSSPILLPWQGRQQLLFFNRDDLISLAPGGELLWRMPFLEHPIKIAQPVFVPPDMVFVSASYDLGAMVVRMRARQDGVITAEKLWESRVIRSHFSTGVARDGMIYGFDNATLKCVDAATGEQRWAKRGGFGKGSLIWADGHLIVLTEQGRLLLIEATAEDYYEKGSVKILSGRTWTPPSLADGRLYVRSRSELVALDLRRERLSPSAETIVAVAQNPAAQQTLTESTSDRPVGLGVDAVVEGYIHARGDTEALARIVTARLSGRYYYDGDVYPFTIYHDRPYGYRFETRRPDDGELVVVACNATTGWRRLDDIPRQLLDGIFSEPVAEMSADELARIREEEADFEGPLVHWREKGHQVELLGRQLLDDTTPVYHLQITLKSGRVQHWYIDQENFTLVKKTTSQVDYVPAGRPPHLRHSYFREYRRVEGILLPVRYESEDFQLVRTFEVDQIELNVELDDRLFTIPKPANGHEKAELSRSTARSGIH